MGFECSETIQELRYLQWEKGKVSKGAVFREKITEGKDLVGCAGRTEEVT